MTTVTPVKGPASLSAHSAPKMEAAERAVTILDVFPLL